MSELPKTIEEVELLKSMIRIRLKQKGIDPSTVSQEWIAHIAREISDDIDVELINRQKDKP